MKGLLKILAIIIYIFLVSCEKLDVENLNNPDQEKTNNSPSGLESLAKGLYLNYWNSTHAASGSPTIGITALVAADQFTASWKNFGWFASSLEPRQRWDNSISAENDQVTENFYFAAYRVIKIANTIIEKISVDHIQLGNGGINNTKYLALSYLIKGAEYGNLGIVFDATPVEGIISGNSKDTIGYYSVIDKAIKSLNTVISICDTASFTLSGSIFNSNDITSEQLKQIAHSYIARFLVLSSRNSSDNKKVDWNFVLDNANKGITFDFGSTFDGLPYDGAGGTWYDLNLYYLVRRDWARIDNRIINLFDPAYPKRYPSSGNAPKVHSGLKAGQASSLDSRLGSDFEFLSSINFVPSRGTYHYSNYRYKRFDALLSNSGSGMLYEIRQYENELYKAEAYIMINKNDITNPLNILNNSVNPRIKRGTLKPLNALVKDDIINAIFYERDIELMAQSFMLGFCDMRRRNMLQYGTPLHFPIPGRELQALNMNNYTYGGAGEADGVNTSSGGWFDK